MWELDYKESWALKNWCFWTVVLEKTLESPLDCKEIQPVHLKGDQSWIFIGRSDAEAETPILWPPDAKNLPIWIDPDAGKYWRQEEKGTTEDEMVGCHRRLDGQVWVNSRSWCWTGNSGVLQSMGSQRVAHDWATELKCPWDFPGKNTGEGCHFLLQRIVPTQGSNPASCISCIAGGFFTSWATRKLRSWHLVPSLYGK